VGRILQSIVVGVLLIAVNAPPSRADGAREDEQLNAAAAVQYESADLAPLEKLVLKTVRGRAAREGDLLTLYFGDGSDLVLRDSSRCTAEDISNDTCVGYNLVADLPSRHAFVVVAGHYKGGEVWLIDARTGRKTVLPAIPQFGPDDREFITLDNGFAYGEPGITLWRWRDGTGEVIWRHGVELDPIYHETTLVHWREPDAIDLDLSVAASVENPETHWPAVARRSPEGWRLESKWPKLNCTACRNPNFN
jgi:hypothetical protein